jgi:uncharacterized Rmd1/YagE family protein
MPEVVSYQIADSIDIKGLRSAFKADPVYSDSDELFYRPKDDQYIYVFKYGVASFLNYNPVEISGFLQLIIPFSRNTFQETLSESFLIETGVSEYKVGYNKIGIRKVDDETIRLIMMNVGQSVALDYYLQQTTRLLEETNSYTQILEKKGRLDISGKNLKKYIAKTLILKNRIAENLYIFDSPDETWENEELNRIDHELKKVFELQDRFRNISEGLQIVKENLELFRDLLQHRNSNVLEWIVIILIAIEVVNLFFEKLHT